MTILTTQVRINSSLKEAFIDWQAKFNAVIATFPGFISLEILSPSEASHQAWILVQRFSKSEWSSHWQQSKERRQLLEELNKLLGFDSTNSIQEVNAQPSQFQGVITEVFITQVAQGMESAYREWIAKIHQTEAKFPGFRGMYVQSPSQGQGRNWITLLQFDTPENLDHWLASPERMQLLSESVPFISSLENHRVISSPFAGWFSSFAKTNKLPSAWKQTMLVLLILFPIVMLEMKYLPLLTAELNTSLATFIGNAISVTLIAWPLMPMAIRCFSGWLSPKESQKRQTNLVGTGFICFLYLIEIILFWNLF